MGRTGCSEVWVRCGWGELDVWVGDHGRIDSYILQVIRAEAHHGSDEPVACPTS